MRVLWGAFCVIGTVLPYAVFVPWLVDHGLDFGLLYEQATSSGGAAFAWLDVVVSAAVVLTLAFRQLARGARQYWYVVAGTCLVGVSLGLPLYLFLSGGSERRGAA